MVLAAALRLSFQSQSRPSVPGATAPTPRLVGPPGAVVGTSPGCLTVRRVGGTLPIGAAPRRGGPEYARQRTGSGQPAALRDRLFPDHRRDGQRLRPPRHTRGSLQPAVGASVGSHGPGDRLRGMAAVAITLSVMPTLSFVVPVKDEEEVLPELHRRWCGRAGHPGECEFILGGRRQHRPQPRGDERAAGPRRAGELLFLARNFGHQLAISAGLDFATGDAVVIIDGDLQDPPRSSSE